MTEKVFTLIGVGRFVVDAVAHGDYPVVQALVFLIAFGFVIVNRVIDLTYAWLPPVSVSGKDMSVDSTLARPGIEAAATRTGRAADELVKFIRTKPLGVAGAVASTSSVIPCVTPSTRSCGERRERAIGRAPGSP